MEPVRNEIEESRACPCRANLVHVGNNRFGEKFSIVVNQWSKDARTSKV